MSTWPRWAGDHAPLERRLPSRPPGRPAGSRQTGRSPRPV